MRKVEAMNKKQAERELKKGGLENQEKRPKSLGDVVEEHRIKRAPYLSIKQESGGSRGAQLLSNVLVEQIKELRDTGTPWKKIEDKLGVSHGYAKRLYNSIPKTGAHSAIPKEE